MSLIKLAPFIVATVGLLSSPASSASFAAESDSQPVGEVAALEKKLTAARDELTAAKTALVIARSEKEAAEARAKALARPDSEVESLRSEVRILERDLQSAMTGLKRLAVDKAAAESALAAANQRLAATGGKAIHPTSTAAAAGVRATPETDARMTQLQAEVTTLRTRLAEAEKSAKVEAAELARLRANPAPPPAAMPAALAEEFAELRKQSRLARELAARVTSLEAENATLLSRAAEHDARKGEHTSALAARQEVERKLATADAALAALTKERDDLRLQSARAGELENRIRQLEATTPSREPGGRIPAPAGTGSPDTAFTKDEHARLTAALADAQGKLATVLRSFTLLSKERDELRERLAALSGKKSVPEEKR